VLNKDIEKNDEFFTEKMQNPRNKFAHYVPDFALLILENMYKKKFKMNQKHIFMALCGLASQPNHFTFDLMDEVIQYLFQAGITDQLTDYHKYVMRETIQQEEPRRPQVFRLEDLSFGFVVWLVACGFCIAVFFSETYFLIKQKFRRILGSFFALFNMLRFLRDKRFL
jgi:hypothetical protein